MKASARVACLLLVACLMTTGVLKMIAVGEGSILGPVSARVLACAEVVLAWGLLTPRHRGISLLGAVVLALAGGAWSLFVSVPCGCAGPIALSRQGHFLLSMTIGFLACVMTLEEFPERRRRAPSQNA